MAVMLVLCVFAMTGTLVTEGFRLPDDDSDDVNNLDVSSGDGAAGVNVIYPVTQEKSRFEKMFGFNCQPGEMFTMCGSKCLEDTCTNYGTERFCPQSCNVGCLCAKGLVRNDADVCVNPTDCPPIVTTPSMPSSLVNLFDPDRFAEMFSYLCQPGEVARVCASRCLEDTCANYGTQRSCPRSCKVGCFCSPGLVRNDANVCVEPADCPPIVTTPSIFSMCPPGEAFKTCGSRCIEDTCSNYGTGPRVCTRSCQFGCFCAEGLVRNDEDVCVEPTDCPPTVTSPSVASDCPPGEVFGTCGSRCTEDTCSNYGIPRVCPRNCQMGCFCAEGLVRNDEDVCVEPTDCPPTVTSPSDDSMCPPGEVFGTCGSRCNEDTCSNYGTGPRVCPRSCEIGCFCAEGLVRNDADACVNPTDCPPTANSVKLN